MRPFDWRTFLREQRIPVVERGPNVKRGEFNIHCPFCGSADPSAHMGIQPETGWFSCWRNRAQHSGKSPLRLIVALLGVPYWRARELAGLSPDYVDPEGFDALAARLLRQGGTGRPEEVRRRRLLPDPSFVPIRPHGRARLAYEYLAQERGFSGRSGAGEDVDVLVRLYGLMAGGGAWTGRVICPYVMEGELVAWTGRAIGPSTARYLDLSPDECVVPPKGTLYNHDALLDRSARVLLVLEGPFDVLKADFYGEPYGVRAVGMSTAQPTEDQQYLLQAAAGLFDRVLVGADNKTGYGAVESMRVRSLLPMAEVGVAHVPFGAGDPGELTPAQATRWAQTLAESPE